MATSLILNKDERSNSLVAVTAHDSELIRELSAGVDFTAKLTRVRSARQSKWYWSLLGLLVDNQDHYKTSEQLHVWLKLKCGLVDGLEFHDGRVFFQVKSTAMGSMGQSDFNNYLNSVLDLVAVDIVPGIKRSDLMREINLRVGYDICKVNKMEFA